MKTILSLLICILIGFSCLSQNVGIDITNPLFKLDVRNGSINTDSVYRIATKTVLATPSTNLFIGKNAGRINAGGHNTFAGFNSAFSNTDGEDNSFFGFSAGWSNTLGSGNSFFGANVGFNNTSGHHNSLFGLDAGVQLSTGYYNSFFGFSAGFWNNTGHDNSFYGVSAGQANNTGNNNAFFGGGAGFSNTGGSFNSFQGASSGFLNNTGNYNTALGFEALNTNTAGTYNTSLGTYSDLNTNSLTNATAIGAYARVDCNNCLVLGSVNGVNGGTANVNVGIGSTNPIYPLTFAQTLGDKISLYNDNMSSYGFGINNSLMLIHTSNASSDIAFGYEDMDNFTERMRIKGSGKVGIGIINPAYKLDVRFGSINTDSLYRINTFPVVAIPGTGNLFVGKESGKVNTGSNNTFIGDQSGYANTSGSTNSFFGKNAGVTNTNGLDNSFFGASAGKLNLTGDYNSFFGVAAGFKNTGDNNSFFGRSAGQNNELGEENSFFGVNAGFNNQQGSYNSFYGVWAGTANTSGEFNTANGYSALDNNSTGSRNTALGSSADVNAVDLTNATALGANARVDCSNCMVLGSVNGINGGTSNVNVGIGTNTPAHPLSFAQTTGDKISLYNDGAASYGFGIAGGLLEIHTNTSGADIAFGYGNYASFTETMRIKGSGKVGIGITNPAYKLDVRLGSINTDTMYRINTFPVLAIPGTGNLFIGKNAGKVTTGNNNLFAGSFSGIANTTGFANAFVGESSGLANISGHDNIFIGQSTGFNNLSGDENSFLGKSAGFANNSGDQNTAVGYQSLNTNTTGTLNTAIGHNADVNAVSLTNATALGASARVDCSNCMVLGSVNGINGGTSNVNVGIGVNTPAYLLDVAGRMRIRSGGSNSTSAGLWFNNNANNATRAFLGMEDDDYIGIYFNPIGFQFKVNANTGNVAIGLGDPTEKLTVFGNFRANGNICYTGTIGACSDIRYKKDVSPISGSLGKVVSMQGIYYYWKLSEFPGKGFNEDRQLGFSAQDVEKLFPEIVQTDQQGYKSVDYGRLTPVLVEAIKEQQLQIDAQQKEIDTLKGLVMQMVKEQN